MNKHASATPRHFLQSTASAWLVLLLSLAASALLWRYSMQESERRAADRFDYRADKLALLVRERMQLYELALQGGAALFAASGSVTRAEWREYVKELDVPGNLPGVQGIGFAQLIPADGIAEHTAALRAEGFADYGVRPAGERELYTSIVFLEPFEGRNLRAFGFDMYSEAVRREAMQRARDSGTTAMSGRVTLVQETDKDVQSGFLIYRPVYRNGSAVGTVEERRGALLGWVYSPFRVRDLMTQITKGIEIDAYIELYDGAAEPANLLFASPRGEAQPELVLDRHVDISGHGWTLRVLSSDDFEQRIASYQPRVILIGGFALGLSVFIVMMFNAGFQRRLQTAAGAVRESHDQYLALVDSVPGTVFRTEATAPWTITFLSRGITELTGRSPESIVDARLPLETLVHPDDRRRVLLIVNWASSRQHPYEIEFRVEDDAGRTRWLAMRCRTTHDPAGQPLCMEGVIVDITHRKSIEDQLRSTSAYARSLLEASLDPLVVISPDGKVTDVNIAAEQVTGVPREQLIGGDFSRWFTDPERASSGHEKVFAEGDVRDYPLAIRHRDGHITHVLFNASVYRDEDGTVVGVFAAARDITSQRAMTAELERHRERLEEQVAQRTAELQKSKEAAEVANVAKSAFLATMSHELRTPMNAVIGFSQLLLRSELGQTQRDHLEKILTASRHLLKLLNDILDFTQLESGRLSLDVREFRLQDVVEKALGGLRAQARAKNVAFAVSVAPEVPPVLNADPQRIEQVLVHLGDNAVKFTDHGRVSIAIEVRARDADAVTLLVRVRDTGIGIDAEHRARLFRHFEQADSSSTRRYGGTGIGLALAQRLVERMGGEIGVESTPGEGSTFWFTLRAGIVAAPAGAAPAAAAGKQPVPGGARVLVVDDNPLNQEVVVALLADAGIESDVAANGAEAIERLDAGRYDLVLMDLQMPVMDGVTATQEIRRRPRFAELPVLAMTANVFESDRQRAHQAGMNDFIAKPMDPDTFLETLRRWIDLPGPAAGSTAAAGPATATAVDVAALEAACTELLDLLRSDDMLAGACLRRHGALLREAFGEGFDAIDAAVGRFDFAAATVALEHARRSAGLATA